jgi:tetratricopeptide (TPR) repeat protein
MKKLIVVLFSLALIAGCTKMEEKKSTDANKNSNLMGKNTDKGDPHSGMNMSDNTVPSDGTKDPKAEELTKAANDFDKVYEKNKSEANKKEFIEKHIAAGIYLTYEANLNPKEKYGPALKHFRKVLEVDPQNKEALQNKEQIESIYEQMGRPIPQ